MLWDGARDGAVRGINRNGYVEVVGRRCQWESIGTIDYHIVEQIAT